MAVVPDIISGYLLVTRGDMKILAIILSFKIIYDIQGCVVKLWKLNHFKYA